jgi:micrococcal nuclease
MEHTLYNYKAVVTSVYDGDTCTVDIDLGLHTWIRGEKSRLN